MAYIILIFFTLTSLITKAASDLGMANCEKDFPTIGVLEYLNTTKRWQYREVIHKEGNKWETHLLIDESKNMCTGFSRKKLLITFDQKVLQEISIKYPKIFPRKMTVLDDETIKSIKLPLRKLYSKQSDMENRPYIVTSLKKFSDPDNWHIQILTSAEVIRAKAAYRKNIQIYIPTNSPVEDWVPFTKYTDDLLIPVKSFSNNKGHSIIGLTFDLKRVKQNFPEIKVAEIRAEDSAETLDFEKVKWFYLVGEKVELIKPAESNIAGHDPFPIDAGDYDGDGKSEFIFGSESSSKYRESNDIFDNFFVYP